ncbi:MAG TPA: hypothetical protein VE954_38395 [Oligoflexus sp.]|uniref:hypothetical protein n=1 Tax=Oligoflexus sp. TaxID=1971216 RepID=UPI002D737580|nr:hypothetical protein [Oligoflexus sp.]HYX39011.1 hypothetical protein [Oligoflexus sp.]
MRTSRITLLIGLGLSSSYRVALAQMPLEKASESPSTQWYIHSGLMSDAKTSSAPDDTANGLQLTTQKFEETMARLQLGLLHELKPWKGLDVQGRLEYVGNANIQRNAWETFSRETSYDNFPLAPHRAWHTFRGRVLTQYHLTEAVRLGVDTSYDQTIRGSSLFREDSDLETSPLKTGLSYYMMPYTDAVITQADRIRVYSIFYKNIDSISDLNSYKSYAPGKPSLGVKYLRTFTEQGFELAAHAFRYEILFNDESSDFVRTGSSLKLDWQPFSNGLSFGLYGAFWSDDFVLPSAKIGDCRAGVIEDSSDADVKLCSRLDNRYSFGASTHYKWSERSSFSFRFVTARNRNNDIQGFDFDQNTYTLMYTFAAKGFNHRILEERAVELEGMLLRDAR